MRLVRPADGIAGAVCGQDQDGDAGQAADKKCEEVFRALVDQWKILADHDLRPMLARATITARIASRRLLAAVVRSRCRRASSAPGRAKSASRTEASARYSVEIVDAAAQLLLDLQALSLLRCGTARGEPRESVHREPCAVGNA